jgi:methionyl-tRNA formyltransferase
VLPDEPVLTPVFLAGVLPALREDSVMVVLVPPVFRNERWHRYALRVLRAFGPREAIALGGAYLRGKASAKLACVAGRKTDAVSLARAHGAAVVRTRDLGGREFLARIRAFRPSLVFSVSCPQIFTPELLGIPDLGCVNVHSGLLPAYRGVLTNFWTLLNGETETGVTLHLMTAGIDQGDILAERRWPVGPDDTMYSLMLKCRQCGADLTLEAIRRFREGTVVRTENRFSEGSYFSFPTREDVAAFRARRLRLR